MTEVNETEAEPTPVSPEVLAEHTDDLPLAPDDSEPSDEEGEVENGGGGR